MSVHRFLINSEYVLIAASTIIGFVQYKKLKTELRYVLYFVCLGAFTEIFNFFYKTFLFKNNMPIGHFYITFSIVILSFMYKRLLAGYLNRHVFNLFISSFILFAIINPIFLQSLWEFPNILGAVGALMLIVFSILFYGKMMTEVKLNRLTDNALVWVNSLVLFYYTGNFFFYILFNLNVANSMEFARISTRFYLILNILLYLSTTFILVVVNNRKRK